MISDYILKHEFPIIAEKIDGNWCFWSIENITTKICEIVDEFPHLNGLDESLMKDLTEQFRLFNYIIKPDRVTREYILDCCDLDFLKNEQVKNEEGIIIPFQDFKDQLKDYEISKYTNPVYLECDYFCIEIIPNSESIICKYLIFTKSRQLCNNEFNCDKVQCMNLSLILGIQYIQVEFMYQLFKVFFNLNFELFYRITGYFLTENKEYQSISSEDDYEVLKNSIENLPDVIWDKSKFRYGFLAGYYWRDQIKLLKHILEILLSIFEEKEKESKPTQFIIEAITEFTDKINSFNDLEELQNKRNNHAHIIFEINSMSELKETLPNNNTKEIFIEFCKKRELKVQLLELIKTISNKLFRNDKQGLLIKLIQKCLQKKGTV